MAVYSLDGCCHSVSLPFLRTLLWLAAEPFADIFLCLGGSSFHIGICPVRAIVSAFTDDGEGNYSDSSMAIIQDGRANVFLSYWSFILFLCPLTRLRQVTYFTSGLSVSQPSLYTVNRCNVVMNTHDGALVVFPPQPDYNCHAPHYFHICILISPVPLCCSAALVNLHFYALPNYHTKPLLLCSLLLLFSLISNPLSLYYSFPRALHPPQWGEDC